MPGRGDVLLLWNRYGDRHREALAAERAGATVLVAENGYLGRGGTAPKWDLAGGMAPDHYVALARGYHNGRGEWHVGGPERWDALGIRLAEKRGSGHILVAPNRPFGVEPAVMPHDWADRTAERLRKQTKREVRIRRHPGNKAPERPLEADLEGCFAMVIWSSGAGIQGLIRGIPVFVEAPFWICRGARALGPIEEPIAPEPTPALIGLSWAQWRLEEVETGMPFRRILDKA